MLSEMNIAPDLVSADETYTKTIIDLPENKKQNLPKRVTVYSKSSFQDVYARAVLDTLRVMLNPT